jgi:hypothetical protein
MAVPSGNVFLYVLHRLIAFEVAVNDRPALAMGFLCDPFAD